MAVLKERFLQLALARAVASAGAAVSGRSEVEEGVNGGYRLA